MAGVGSPASNKAANAAKPSTRRSKVIKPTLALVVGSLIAVLVGTLLVAILRSLPLSELTGLL